MANIGKRNKGVCSLSESARKLENVDGERKIGSAERGRERTFPAISLHFQSSCISNLSAIRNLSATPILNFTTLSLLGSVILFCVWFRRY